MFIYIPLSSAEASKEKERERERERKQGARRIMGRGKKTFPEISARSPFSSLVLQYNQGTSAEERVYISQNVTNQE